MTTSVQILSNIDFDRIPDGSSMRIGIVGSEWNRQITGKLVEGACRTLEQCNVRPDNIFVEWVPGSIELTFGARRMAEEFGVDAVIAIGCVIKGETSHFDYVCASVTQGITELNARCDIPFIFGVLTTDNMQQAEDRAGGQYGNKGEEAAFTAIKMIDFCCRLKK